MSALARSITRLHGPKRNADYIVKVDVVERDGAFIALISSYCECCPHDVDVIRVDEGEIDNYRRSRDPRGQRMHDVVRDGFIGLMLQRGFSKTERAS